MNKALIALGWGCSTFAAGMASIDLTPLGANPAVLGLLALGLNTAGGVLYVYSGKRDA